MAYDISDYITVNERVAAFHEAYPDGSLQSDWRLVELDGKQTLIVKAYAYRDRDDKRPGIGHATEPLPGLTKFTRNSELMVGETSAWGRALAALGFEVRRSIASREEVQNRQDADGGGVNDSLSTTQSPAAAVSGFASKRQASFFGRLLKERGLDSNQVEAVNRWMETLSADDVRGTIDNVKDAEGDKGAKSVLAAAEAYAKRTSDVPYDANA